MTKNIIKQPTNSLQSQCRCHPNHPKGNCVDTRPTQIKALVRIEASGSCHWKPQLLRSHWNSLWLCQNSYWKWPFIVDLAIENGGSFHSYVAVYQRVRQTAETTEIDVLHHFDEKLQHSTLNNLWFQAGHEEDHGPQTPGQDIPGDRNSMKFW